MPLSTPCCDSILPIFANRLQQTTLRTSCKIQQHQPSHSTNRERPAPVAFSKCLPFHTQHFQYLSLFHNAILPHTNGVYIQPATQQRTLLTSCDVQRLHSHSRHCESSLLLSLQVFLPRTNESNTFLYLIVPTYSKLPIDTDKLHQMTLLTSCDARHPLPHSILHQPTMLLYCKLSVFITQPVQRIPPPDSTNVAPNTGTFRQSNTGHHPHLL